MITTIILLAILLIGVILGVGKLIPNNTPSGTGWYYKTYIPWLSINRITDEEFMFYDNDLTITVYIGHNIRFDILVMWKPSINSFNNYPHRTNYGSFNIFIYYKNLIKYGKWYWYKPFRVEKKYYGDDIV